ncbi:MAG: hypothetical protein AMJ58_00775 [Gammaproteobacteria bacterium SG8_30]|nr:MAG: hypothetical protein AMJ58_00775 [Gammaproteobacteria bacterium SG8_30]
MSGLGVRQQVPGLADGEVELDSDGRAQRLEVGGDAFLHDVADLEVEQAQGHGEGQSDTRAAVLRFRQLP